MAGLLGGCASGFALHECQEFGGRTFDVTTLTIPGEQEIYIGGNVGNIGNCSFGIGGEHGTPAVYRSLDKGKTWAGELLPVAYKFHGSKVTSIATEPDGTIVAVVALEPAGVFNLPWESHIYRSQNKNYGWKELHQPFEPAYVSSFTVAPNSNIFVSICGAGIYRYQGGIYLSQDGGLTWSFAGLSTPPLKGYPGCWSKVFADADGYVYAYAQGANGVGFYRSIDNGVTWHRLPIKPSNGNKIASNSRGFLVAAASGPWEASLYYSTDHGERWENIKAPHEMRIESLAVGKNGEIYVKTMVDLFSLGGGAFRSTDGGKSWVRFPHWPTSSGLAVDREGVLFSANEGYPKKEPALVFGGKVYRSLDQGTTWELLSIFPRR